MEVITERYPGGNKQATSYFIGGEEVGNRERDEEDRLDYECAKSGPRRGSNHCFHAEGGLLAVQPYLNG